MLSDCSLKGFDKSNEYKCESSKFCLSSFPLTEKLGNDASGLTRAVSEMHGVSVARAVTHLTPYPLPLKSVSLQIELWKKGIKGYLLIWRWIRVLVTQFHLLKSNLGFGNKGLEIAKCSFDCPCPLCLGSMLNRSPHWLYPSIHSPHPTSLRERPDGDSFAWWTLWDLSFCRKILDSGALLSICILILLKVSIVKKITIYPCLGIKVPQHSAVSSLTLQQVALFSWHLLSYF